MEHKFKKGDRVNLKCYVSKVVDNMITVKSASGVTLSDNFSSDLLTLDTDIIPGDLVAASHDIENPTEDTKDVVIGIYHGPSKVVPEFHVVGKETFKYIARISIDPDLIPINIVTIGDKTFMELEELKEIARKLH